MQGVTIGLRFWHQSTRVGLITFNKKATVVAGLNTFTSYDYFSNQVSQTLASASDETLSKGLKPSEAVSKKTLLRSFCTEGEDESIWTSLTVDDEKVLVKGTVSNGWKEGMEKEFDAVALVLSTTELDSFEYTLEMQNEIQKMAERMHVVFIENKVDVVEESQLDKSAVEGEMKKRRKRLYRKQSASVNNPPVSPPKPSIEDWAEPVPAAPAVSAVPHKKDKCTLM